MTAIERLFIDASTHRLEAVFSRPRSAPRGAFVICHPHPRYGGDMYQNVVVKLAELFLEESFAVLRFNLRGTGKSSGVFMDSLGAREDLKTSLSWLETKDPNRPLWLAGYSYGAYIALSALVGGISGSFPGRFPVGGVLAVSYPASMPECKLDVLPEVPLYFIHGTEDALIPGSTLKLFLQSHHANSEVRWVGGADHFFDGKLVELQKAVRSGLKALFNRED